MRKSLREVKVIDRYLNGGLPSEEQAEFQQRLILDPALRERVDEQRAAYRLIRDYGRRQLRRELESMHQRLMRQNPFRDRIRRIFKI